MDFLSDANGDIAVVNGDFVLVTGTDEIVQFIQQSLRLFLAEWFLDETKGVPYFDEIFVKNPNPVAVDSILKKYIADLPGVQELTSYTSTYDNPTRTLTISGTIRALNGNADFSVGNILPGSV